MSPYHGAEGFNAEPDGPEYIVTANNGFRAWRMTDGGKLLSPVMSTTEWGPGKRTCNCVKTPQSPEGAVALFWSLGGCEGYPTQTCSHGFYAYYAENYWRSEGHVWEGAVLVSGFMEGWGRCVIGERGFRAQHATISAFVEPFDTPESWLRGKTFTLEEGQAWVRANLEREFPSVPIFPSVEQALTIIPLRGKP